MLNIILAVDANYGIGYENKLPWNIKEELSLFKQKTLKTVVIVGSKTYSNLPELKDRIVIPVSRSGLSFEQAVEKSEKEYMGKDIYIIGGAMLYSYVLKKYKKEVKIHISFLKNKYVCDTYFDKDLLKDFYIESKSCHEDFDHCVMIYKKQGEYQYLNLVKDILENGEERIGRNGGIISDFCKHLKFDLRDGFPLLTTKKMFTKGVIEELLFFIRGDTDSKILEEKGINIWKGNTNREFLDKNGFPDRKEGEMGAMYGSIWRNFNGLTHEKEKEHLKTSIEVEMVYKSYNDDKMSYCTDKIKSIDFGIDQLKNVINEIKTNPTSRRILLTTFNPGQVRQGVLYPCHSVMIQFYVQDGYLDMFCYNRSQDIFHGTPFNIASTSLLLMIISKLTNLTPRYVNISMGDTHIYKEHIDGIKKQIERIPYVFPKIILPEFTTLEEVEKLTYEDFNLIEYNYYPTIKMPMIA